MSYYINVRVREEKPPKKIQPVNNQAMNYIKVSFSQAADAEILGYNLKTITDAEFESITRKQILDKAKEVYSQFNMSNIQWDNEGKYIIWNENYYVAVEDELEYKSNTACYFIKSLTFSTSQGADFSHVCKVKSLPKGAKVFHTW